MSIFHLQICASDWEEALSYLDRVVTDFLIAVSLNIDGNEINIWPSESVVNVKIFLGNVYKYLMKFLFTSIDFY